VVSMDAAVRRLYAEAGFDYAMPPGPGPLTVAIFTPQRIHDTPIDAAARASIALHRGRWHLYVHPALHGEALSIELARALADWICLSRGEAHAREELAASILVPTPAILIMRRILRYDLGQIAKSLLAPLAMVEARYWQVFPPKRSGEYVRKKQVAALRRRNDE
jgi:hypothetical protein